MTNTSPPIESPPPHNAQTEHSAPTTSVRLVIASVAVLLLLAALDQTIVSTALPTIVADLGGLNHLSWVVTSYILASTIAAPLYGKFGDLYGRRNVVFISVSIFLVGSVLCGLASSMVFLILARAVQGLGGGGLFVLALSIIGDVLPPKDRGKIQGVFAGVFGLSSVIGPLLGGWFVDALSWHWIFFINLPIGALALVGFLVSFKPTGVRKSPAIDFAGAISLTLALASLVLVTALGGKEIAWSSLEAIGLMTLFVASTTAFIVSELRAAEPILPLSLFKMNVFTVTTLLALLTGAAMLGSITFLPVFLQMAKGASATSSGLQLIPLTVGILTGSTIAGRYMGRTGRYRILPIIGTFLATFGALGLTQISPEMANPLFYGALILFGSGLGMNFPVITTAVQNTVPRAQLGTATAAGVLFRQIGGSVAVALFGAIFASGVANAMGGVHVEGMSSVAELGPQLLAKLPIEIKSQIAVSVTDAVTPIYWIVASLLAIAFVISLFLKEEMLQGHAPK
ncbi:MDR family MFS transporter [Pacificibacter marinus]|uniref:Multidrug resistance protein 3 n=1 Tax=Pacificibacter marinus TaxID=658057 RepID=A0A1Y5SID4_9RHOB|nr:MDR family MFS transporter [Pacificibacter marinus]SEK62205.1 drug resistance transporter, EmrB/QacA subfamily [Pacificibacter marinus]SLN41190.1 Multidrug resistance protein 3 [Pacificibacter marinus]